MKAVVYDAVGAVPVVADVADPTCPADGVLIAVAATGVCRSDWHAWSGHDPVPLPHIPGHEFAGIVVETGVANTGWSVGDRVTTPFVSGCGRCEWCLAGDAQVCPEQTQPGFTGPGSFAELVAVPAAATNLVLLPEHVALRDAAVLGCRFATAYRALTAHGALQHGQWLAVHGCGGVGLSAIMIAVALGARVVAVDVSPQALRRARELGAEALVDARGSMDTAAAVQSATNGGAHLSMDALGTPATALASVLSLRRRGRHLQVGLLLGEHASTPLPMGRVLSWELTVHGCHGMAARDYPAMFRLVADGRLPLSALVGSVIGLDEAPAALMAMDAVDVAAGSITIVQPGGQLLRS